MLCLAWHKSIIVLEGCTSLNIVSTFIFYLQRKCFLFVKSVVLHSPTVLLCVFLGEQILLKTKPRYILQNLYYF